MIDAVAFLPHPPVLVPQVAQGAAAELEGLRAACAAALQRVTAPGRSLVLVGAGPSTRAHDVNARGSLAGFGVALEVSCGDGSGPVDLPLSLTVGCWLAGAGRAFSIGPDAGRPSLPDAPTALLVLGDASARRSTAAPGYLDGRAEGYDRAVGAALASGDPAELAGLDLELGTDLLAAGAPVWRAVAGLLERTYRAELLYDDAPYGVGYLVATWT